MMLSLLAALAFDHSYQLVLLILAKHRSGKAMVFHSLYMIDSRFTSTIKD